MTPVAGPAATAGAGRGDDRLHGAGGRHARPGVHGQRGDDLRQGGRFLPASAIRSGRSRSRTAQAWLAEHGFELRQLDAGHVFRRGRRRPVLRRHAAWPAIAFAATIGGHQQIGDLLGCRVIPLELVDPRYYHLDTCFCPLAPGMAIYYPPAFDDYGRRPCAKWSTS